MLYNAGPLSSTQQFHTRGPLFFSPQNPSVLHQKPLSSTPPSVPPYQFHTENPSVPHKKALYKRASQFFSLRQRMLYEMAASLINSIVEGPDYEHAEVQQKIILQRGQEIQREFSEFDFKRVF